MTFSASRRLPAFLPLAAAVALCFAAAPAVAQSVAAQTLAPIVITGARFASDPAFAPIGATVISADEIRRAGINDVNSAIRKIGGVYGRQSLDGSPDFSLDLRGFGSNSSQNMVVVLDGVRLSENELLNAVLTTVAIDTVERIEITRGGSSVLYGDGATGGIINIVTKRPTSKSGSGSVYTEVGQLGQREARGSIARAWDGFALDATLGTQQTDNYRDNNDYKQTNFSGGAQWFTAAGRMGVRLDSLRQDSRFAGSIKTLSEYLANPRQTSSPDDFGSLDSDRVTAFISQRVAGFDLAAELSHRQKTVKSSSGSGSGLYTAQYDSKQTQFSPRLRQLANVGGMLNEVVAGIDLTRWERDTKSIYGGFPTSAAEASQRSKAIYLRDEIRFDAAHDGRLAAGVRRELFDKDFSDALGIGTVRYNNNQGLNAWDLQASYAVLPLLTAYAKAGQSYRVATADENAFTPKANTPLQAQTSHDLELGASYGNAERKVTAAVFRHKLRNELFYDPTAGAFGANVNLDPTKRQGVELSASAVVAADWTVSGHYQHVQATFTEGVNAGREMILVPKNVLSARLSWTPANGQSADFGAQWVDSQRYGGDVDNSCSSRMPSYTTFDARYARKFGQWELALAALNLGDKQYFSQAFSCRGGIYSSAGRQMKISARYDF
ncbi:TonB-dependent receptor [Rugamonas sp. CCM 8940]|uniref:TonB-dependent receptor n=1 Tax=Rugamonas sp. CCM 8940 TaxID=2765359 RepID=UPI0018F2DF12|nr:TonB-dependent receptor [Rugamonas sp. CCM 8940]MBJ7308661.1 TonB-dependent receptor [Rugamonas sp. CCM 8940]